MGNRLDYEVGWVCQSQRRDPRFNLTELGKVLTPEAIDGKVSVGEGFARAMLGLLGPEVFSHPQHPDFGLILRNPANSSDLPDVLIFSINNEDRGDDRFEELNSSTSLIAITPDGITELHGRSLSEIQDFSPDQQQEFLSKLRYNISEKKSGLPMQPSEQDFHNWEGFQMKNDPKAWSNKLIWDSGVMLGIRSVLTRRHDLLKKESQ